MCIRDRGDLIDLEYFCSDNCAKTSDNYKGWYGCVEIEKDNQEICANTSCNKLI